MTGCFRSELYAVIEDTYGLASWGCAWNWRAKGGYQFINEISESQ